MHVPAGEAGLTGRGHATRRDLSWHGADTSRPLRQPTPTRGTRAALAHSRATTTSTPTGRCGASSSGVATPRWSPAHWPAWRWSAPPGSRIRRRKRRLSGCATGSTSYRWRQTCSTKPPTLLLTTCGHSTPSSWPQHCDSSRSVSTPWLPTTGDCCPRRPWRSCERPPPEPLAENRRVRRPAGCRHRSSTGRGTRAAAPASRARPRGRRPRPCGRATPLRARRRRRRGTGRKRTAYESLHATVAGCPCSRSCTLVSPPPTRSAGSTTSRQWRSRSPSVRR